jgi:hypothetical protein
VAVAQMWEAAMDPHDAFVDTSVGGATELRIHGVSGTPPESVLGHPYTDLIKGDREAGFYRRMWYGGPPEQRFGDDAGRRRREAYEWGGLTSGSGLRAFWLLLLPFMLVNLGFFMTPRPPARARALRRTADGLNRWFALTLTGTLVLAACGLAVDLVGWQCTAPGGACRAEHGTDPGWLYVFSVDWMTPADRRLAVASLLPAAVVVLLWVLGRWTWTKHERTAVPAPGDKGVTGEGLRLGERKLWNGAAAVGRLRSLHVAAGFATVALVVAWPFTAGRVAAVMVAATAVVLGGAVVLTALHPVAARIDPGESAGTGRSLSAWCTGVRWAAVAAYVAVVVLALFDRLGPEPNRAAQPELPGFAGTVAGLYLAQLALLVLLTVITVVLARLTRGDGPDALYRRALHGLAAPVVLLFGWLLAGGFAAGGSIQLARMLGTPVTAAGAAPGGRLVVPGAYWWVALGTVALAAGLVLTIGALLLVWWLRRRALDAMLRPVYGEVAERARVARFWAAADLTDRAGLAFGGLGVFATVLIVVGTFGYASDFAWPDQVHWLTTLGSWIIGGFAVGLLLLGRDVYRRPSLRRMVGVLWDVGTFWPRAIHPFAPPCYTERVIPDLIHRVADLTPGERDRVVLSGHSQGSVLAIALVLQLDAPSCRRVRLLTYGCPISRLYGRFFPAYFNATALRRVEQALTEPAGVAWCNLYRFSDPIGGPALVRQALRQLVENGERPLNHHEIDHHLWDPALGAANGDAPPIIYSHSDYFTGPAYGECLSHLTRT